MKKLFTLSISIFVFGLTSIAQEWQQTGGIPDGSGITEIVVLQESNDLFVTTASFDWPNGQDGGVRRSMDDGDTWDNVFDAFNGRTITAGADGNLYASVWPFPDEEGLYRSSDNGNTWDLLVTVPTGNNIFSIAISTVTNPTTIFAGTRNGVLRSTDNGATWAFSSTGIPSNSWIRDLEVDLGGIVAAGTTSGLFTSEDNGATWDKATGDGIDNEVVTKLRFDYSENKKMGGGARLISGSENGSVWQSFEDSRYLTATLMAIFEENEISGMWIFVLAGLNKSLIGVTQWPTGTQPSGFKKSVDKGVTWEQKNTGLPGGNSPPASALSGSSDDTEINLKVGLFQNMKSGAKVFKMTYQWADIPTDIEDYELNPLTALTLYQNYPNPFDQNTIITYLLSDAGQVNLAIYASDGQLVDRLIDSRQQRGEHRVDFNAENLTEGVYYYKLETEGISEVRKMIVLR